MAVGRLSPFFLSAPLSSFLTLALRVESVSVALQSESVEKDFVPVLHSGVLEDEEETGERTSLVFLSDGNLSHGVRMQEKRNDFLVWLLETALINLQLQVAGCHFAPRSFELCNNDATLTSVSYLII